MIGRFQNSFTGPLGSKVIIKRKDATKTQIRHYILWISVVETYSKGDINISQGSVTVAYL